MWEASRPASSADAGPLAVPTVASLSAIAALRGAAERAGCADQQSGVLLLQGSSEVKDTACYCCLPQIPPGALSQGDVTLYPPAVTVSCTGGSQPQLQVPAQQLRAW